MTIEKASIAAFQDRFNQFSPIMLLKLKYDFKQQTHQTITMIFNSFQGDYNRRFLDECIGFQTED